MPVSQSVKKRGNQTERKVLERSESPDMRSKNNASPHILSKNERGSVVITERSTDVILAKMKPLTRNERI